MNWCLSRKELNDYAWKRLICDTTMSKLYKCESKVDALLKALNSHKQNSQQQLLCLLLLLKIQGIEQNARFWLTIDTRGEQVRPDRKFTLRLFLYIEVEGTNLKFQQNEILISY